MSTSLLSKAWFNSATLTQREAVAYLGLHNGDQGPQ